jgi:Helix-turn-helix domain
MGQVLHGSATTTEAIRRALQNSQKSLRALARRYGINQKTVAKWKKRGSVADLPTGFRMLEERLAEVGEAYSGSLWNGLRSNFCPAYRYPFRKDI